MPGLPASLVLDLWERAERASPTDRAVMLACAGSDARPAEVADEPLGRRDARLLALHAQLSEHGLEGIAECPACAERVEFSVDPGALVAGAAAPAAAVPLEAGGIVMTWRAPTSRDVAAAAAAGEAAGALDVLLQRCVASATGADGPVEPAALPPAARAALAQAMAAADPLAELLLDLVCPACGAAVVAELDAGEFAWAALRDHARRLLREIGVLARAYGWTEQDVLALGARRRAAYLELALEGA
jgi:hypothetical protein